MIPSGRQFREGRESVGLSQADLATAADVALALVVRIEATDGMPMARKPDLTAIQRALEAAGVEFVGEAGVRLRKGERPRGEEDR